MAWSDQARAAALAARRTHGKFKVTKDTITFLRPGAAHDFVRGYMVPRGVYKVGRVYAILHPATAKKYGLKPSVYKRREKNYGLV